VFVNGEPVEVPGGIGINIDDPAVKTLEGQTGDGARRHRSSVRGTLHLPLHTHEPDGILHTESAVDDPNTLGEFFIEWDVALTPECVGVYCKPEASIQVFVDGELNRGDPADIQLVDLREIAIVIGSPPDDIPSQFPGS
jgi:hypothetical protein